jgi:hypothetical protein
MALYYRCQKQKPLLNRYAFMTMAIPVKFDHHKATLDFGYQPRPLQETMDDTIADLRLRAIKKT